LHFSLDVVASVRECDPWQNGSSPAAVPHLSALRGNLAGLRAQSQRGDLCFSVFEKDAFPQFIPTLPFFPPTLLFPRHRHILIRNCCLRVPFSPLDFAGISFESLFISIINSSFSEEVFFPLDEGVPGFSVRLLPPLLGVKKLTSVAREPPSSGPLSLLLPAWGFYTRFTRLPQQADRFEASLFSPYNFICFRVFFLSNPNKTWYDVFGCSLISMTPIETMPGAVRSSPCFPPPPSPIGLLFEFFLPSSRTFGPCPSKLSLQR